MSLTLPNDFIVMKVSDFMVVAGQDRRSGRSEGQGMEG